MFWSLNQSTTCSFYFGPPSKEAFEYQFYPVIEPELTISVTDSQSIRRLIG